MHRRQHRGRPSQHWPDSQFHTKGSAAENSNLNLWKVHWCVGELVSCDGEVDGDQHQVVQAREGLGQGKERTL